MKRAVLIILAALCTVTLADQYEIHHQLVDQTKFRGLLRTVTELVNDTNRSMSYYYSIDKERCFRWNIGVTVLRTFKLGSSQSGCESTGSYTTSGTLDEGQSMRVYAQAWAEYATYLAQRIRIDDATKTETVVDSVYATRERNYEDYWRVVR